MHHGGVGFSLQSQGRFQRVNLVTLRQDKVRVKFAIHYQSVLQKSSGQFWWTWTDGKFMEFRYNVLRSHLIPAFTFTATFTPLRDLFAYFFTVGSILEKERNANYRLLS